MGTITKAVLLRLQLQGFKGHKDSITFDFESGKTIYVGENSEGKTSIGDGINWIWTGRNMGGEQKEINVLNKDSSVCHGIMTLKDQNGDVHEVERKLTASGTTIKFDWNTVPQKFLEELIPSDLFLTVFNPIYFLNLSPTAGRKTIVSLLPSMSKESILSEMDDFQREALEKEEFQVDSTNTYLKNRNAELSGIDENRKWLEGYMASLREPITVPEAKVFDETPLLEARKKLEVIVAKKPELKSLEEQLAKKNEIQAQLTKVQVYQFPSLAKIQELKQEKAVLEQKLVTEQQKQYVPVNPAELEAKRQTLRSDYVLHQTTVKGFDEQVKTLDAKHVHVKEGEQCPYCKQTISKEGVETLQNELKAEVEKNKAEIETKKSVEVKTLEQLAEEGKKLNEEIAAALEKDKQAREKFESEKTQAIEVIQKRITEIDAELKAITKEETDFENRRKAKTKELEDQITALGIANIEKENAIIQTDFNRVVGAEKATVEQEIDRLQKEQKAAIAYEAERKAVQKRKDDKEKELVERQKEMEGYAKSEEEIRLKIYNMKSFNAKKIELLNGMLKPHLKNVEIRLERTIESTGEVKEVFEILYNKKELKICSTSETIKAGIEISRMVSKLAGVQYPVFVDNGESITSYEDADLQIIEVRVQKDKALSVIKGGVEEVVKTSTKPIVSSKPKASRGVRTASAIDPATSDAAV